MYLQYRLELSLQGADKEHLEKFAKFLKATKPDIVKVYKNYKEGKYNRCRVSVRSKHLWGALNSKGCIPKKSLVLTFPSSDIVPNSLIKHFIRGWLLMYNKTRKSRIEYFRHSRLFKRSYC